jgi:glycosyltransferase involved in cell wall biosynthesis
MILSKLPENPKVAILIATLNEEENIGKLLDSIQENNYSNKEVIIIDDGSTDKTVEIAKSKKAIVLINNPGRRGPAFGWNRAAKFTNADIVCPMDADCVIEKHFIEKCVKAFDSKTIAVKPAFKTVQETFLEKIVTDKEGISMEPKFIRRDVYLKVGGFPEIGFGEDQLFSMAITEFARKNGLKEKIVKDTYFIGHGVKTISRMYRQAKWYGKTSIMFLKLLKGSFKEKIKQFFAVYLRMIYFLSFLSIFFIPFHPIFWVSFIPFIIIFASIILKKFKNPYHLLKTITFLIFGLGMFHGLLLYLLGIDRRSGS